jgi:hypothetical protein
MYFLPIVRLKGFSTGHSLHRRPRIAAQRTCLFCPTDVARAPRYIEHPAWPDGAHAVSAPLPSKGISMNLSLHLGPIVSLIAGVLILIMPRLLNYIVAVYLIVIGVIGLFGSGSLRL